MSGWFRFPPKIRKAVMDATADILMFGSDYPHAEGQLDPLTDYRSKVGDMGGRNDAFYGSTYASTVRS